MRERLASVDWQREMLAEAGIGPEPLPVASGPAFGWPARDRHAARRRRVGAGVPPPAVPIPLDARLERALIAACVAGAPLAGGYVAEAVRDMGRHPGWTAFWFLGVPFLSTFWFGPWLIVGLLLWEAFEGGRYIAEEAKRAREAPRAEGPGLLVTAFAVILAELVVDAGFMAVSGGLAAWLF